MHGQVRWSPCHKIEPSLMKALTCPPGVGPTSVQDGITLDSTVGPFLRKQHSSPGQNHLRTQLHVKWLNERLLIWETIPIWMYMHAVHMCVQQVTQTFNCRIQFVNYFSLMLTFSSLTNAPHMMQWGRSSLKVMNRVSVWTTFCKCATNVEGVSISLSCHVQGWSWSAWEWEHTDIRVSVCLC